MCQIYALLIKCMDDDDDDDDDDVSRWCNTCGVREYVFREAPVPKLIELCTRDKTNFSKIICIAHNARAFDAQFILRELAEHSSQVLPSIILSGQNIYYHSPLRNFPAFPQVFARIQSDLLGISPFK